MGRGLWKLVSLGIRRCQSLLRSPSRTQGRVQLLWQLQVNNQNPLALFSLPPSLPEAVCSPEVGRLGNSLEGFLEEEPIHAWLSLEVQRLDLSQSRKASPSLGLGEDWEMPGVSPLQASSPKSPGERPGVP